MRLLLDEMHSPRVAHALRGRSHDVQAVSSDALLQSMKDEELLRHAAEMNQAIVTENVRDYARLTTQWAAKATPHAGVIFTDRNRFSRNTSAYPANLIAALAHFLQHPPIKGTNWAWWLQPAR